MRILRYIADGIMPYDISRRTKYGRYIISRDIAWLIKKGYAIDKNPETNKYKLYIITSVGCTMLDAYDFNEKRKKAKIETAKRNNE